MIDVGFTETVVVLLPGFTLSAPELAPLEDAAKLLSPAYAAVIGSVPAPLPGALFAEQVQLPLASGAGAVHNVVAPVLKTTAPVGEAAYVPPGAGVTVAVKETFWPYVDGLGLGFVTFVVVAAGFTVSNVVPDDEPYVASPGYDAVIVSLPPGASGEVHEATAGFALERGAAHRNCAPAEKVTGLVGAVRPTKATLAV